MRRADGEAQAIECDPDQAHRVAVGAEARLFGGAVEDVPSAATTGVADVLAGGERLAGQDGNADRACAVGLWEATHGNEEAMWVAHLLAQRIDVVGDGLLQAGDIGCVPTQERHNPGKVPGALDIDASERETAPPQAHAHAGPPTLRDGLGACRVRSMPDAPCPVPRAEDRAVWIAWSKVGPSSAPSRRSVACRHRRPSHRRRIDWGIASRTRRSSNWAAFDGNLGG